MVFNSLRDRLSSLWGTDTADDERTGNTRAPSGQHDGPRSNREDKTLSYADQVEYGVDKRDISDEDQILRLLVKRGGRVDETTILEETGWSEDHLSNIVSEMEDDNQVSAITVGRKHVICRRGFEPKGYRSHLNE